jgi:prepilin-type N-terminal cleavage/methylation domain-containing protein
MSRRSSHSAFTLIEFLVVISIIAILAALLMPALSKARNAAQLTQSLANVKQVQLAVLTYANDEKGNLPFPIWPDPLGALYPGYSGPFTYRAYAAVLFERRYVNTPRVFWSPGRDTTSLDFVGMKANPGNTGWYRSGYGINGSGGWQGGRNHRTKLDATGAPHPSRMISLTEGWNINGQAAGLPGMGHYAIAAWRRIATGVPNDIRLFTYDGRAVRGYHDGHGVGGDSRVIGWDTTQLTDPMYRYLGAYAGDWTYTTANEFLNHSPWYTNWPVAGVVN